MDNFLLKLKSLSQNKETLKIDALLREKIKQEPNNIEWLLRLAIVIQYPPIVDTDKSLELLEQVLKLDSKNVTAILLIAYIHHYCLAGLDKTIFDRITTFQTNNDEEKAMLAYAASWFYQDQQDPIGEKHWLLESIKHCNKHVWNHRTLARQYVVENQNNEAKKHLQQALHNIVKIYSGNFNDYDETDVNEFINERIKGIYLTREFATEIEANSK